MLILTCDYYLVGLTNIRFLNYEKMISITHFYSLLDKCLAARSANFLEKEPNSAIITNKM